MLTLDVEWLTGVARLARDPSDPEPDWPPQPDRVYSALVASWGALGEPADAGAALEWLERLGPPQLFCAKIASARPAVDVYVPVNDKRLEKALPDRRTRQARRFAACALPPGPVHLRLQWDATPEAEHLGALCDLAAATSYVGHSASLVRLRFQDDAEPVDDLGTEDIAAAPYPGRLAELKRLHERHMGGDARARPRPSPRLPAPEAAAPRANVFSPEWLVLAHAGGDRPDLYAATALARRLRDAIASALPDPVPSWASGHDADGTPARDAHMAIVPLANAGWEHGDGRLMGLGVVLPHEIRSDWDDRTPAKWKEKRDFEGALATLGDENGVIELKLGRAGVWKLEIQPVPTRRSLDTHRYTKQACIFHTVTPIALDRQLKSEGAAAREEAAAMIARACANIGLPEATHVEVFKHSAIRGAPPAWPPSGAPARPTWARPQFLKSRKLIHARIEFADPVDGPVILGAGRFAGLGLCLPCPEKERE